MITNEQRIIHDVLAYMKIFHQKIDEYEGAIRQGTMRPVEFEEYLKKSVQRINIVSLLLNNLEDRFSKYAKQDTARAEIFDNVRSMNTSWKSTVQIIDLLKKSADIMKTYKGYEKILDNNTRAILTHGQKAYEEIMKLS